MERDTAIDANKKASTINWLTKALLNAPFTLRTPISLPRFVARAVHRFIKLIHAIIKMNMAIRLKSRTYSILPPLTCPFLKLEFKYFSLKGCKLNSSRLVLE
jgi:hypothetical protein